MGNRLYELYDEIRKLEHEMLEEIDLQQERLSYEIKEKTIKFKDEVAAYHKANVMKVLKYIRRSSFKNIVTAPVIWGCIFPAVLMDIMITIYQTIFFPVYGIPKVVRSEYIVLDRRHLKYLNSIQKFNCLYCGYFNGLIGYVQEVAGRTEQYWCPIKHATKLKTVHSRYARFSDFGDCDDYSKRLDSIRVDFDDLRK